MSPFLATKCFGYSPSSGSSQPNSLKLEAKKKLLLLVLNYKWNTIVAIVHLLVIRDWNHSQCADRKIRNSIPYYKEIKVFQCVVSSLHVTPHFVPRCKHQEYSMLQSCLPPPPLQTHFMNIISRVRRLTTFINVMGWGEGGERDRQISTL